MVIVQECCNDEEVDGDKQYVGDDDGDCQCVVYVYLVGGDWGDLLWVGKVKFYCQYDDQYECNCKGYGYFLVRDFFNMLKIGQVVYLDCVR